jgi:pilus assembly protein Flp/PilA
LLFYLKYWHKFLRTKTTEFAGSGRNITRGEYTMKDMLLRMNVKFQSLRNEDGQDLVEYALLVALIALVCIAGVSNVATAVNGVFNNISSSLA